MKLSYIFQQLHAAELSQTKYAVPGSTEITAEHYTPLVAHIQLGLTELHMRFNLKTGSVVLQPEADRTDYIISSENAVSGGGANQYLIDTEEDPFQDNLLKIESIFDAEGNEVVVNDMNDSESILVNEPNQIIIPTDRSDETFTIYYRADHTLLDTGSLDPATTEIILPQTHLKPLLEFIGSRVYSVMPSVEGINQGNIFTKKFEESCARLSNAGITTKQYSSVPITHKDWV